MIDLKERIRDHYQARVAATAAVVEDKLRRAALVDTGRMRDSITVTARNLTLSVNVPVDYASYTSEGTEPHEIAATQAGALRFYWGRVGPPQPRFYRRVWHPGTQPNPWYRDVTEGWTRWLVEVT